MDSSLFVVDTNILLNSPEVLETYSCVLLACVMRELESLKRNRNEGVQHLARTACRHILAHKSRFHFDFNDYRFKENSLWDQSYVDNQILQACINNGYSLITEDVGLYLKALGIGIRAIYHEAEIDYGGYKRVEMTNEELAHTYQNPDENRYDLLVNQYLIIYVDGEHVDSLRWDGDELVQLRLPPSRVLQARNELQSCALDLLYNKEIPIKVLVGCYGSGKTFLSTRMGLHYLDKGHVSKMYVVRSNDGPGREIGFLPGSKAEKTQWMLKPVEQQLEGGEQELANLMNQGKLEIETPFFMKGMTLSGGYWIQVEEAEDMDVHIAKAVGSRIGEDSYIVFSGDHKQAESRYKNNNGLTTIIRKMKGDPNVGIVMFDDNVRSSASKSFSVL